MKMHYFISLMICLLFVATLVAHPASNIKAEFNKETNILTVNFTHQVQEPGKHFIFESVVSVNKNTIIRQTISRQETASGGTLVYKMIDIKPGDKVSVAVTCNKGGKKSTTIEIK